MSVTIASNVVSSETQLTTSTGKNMEYVPTTEQKETEDFDYDPNNDTAPESEDVSLDEQNEESAEQAISENEETIINSIEFQKELASAIENVKYIARCDMEEIFEKAVKNYIDETGEQPTVLQMTDAFNTFTTQSTQQEKVEDVLSEDNEEEFLDELTEAIEHIQELGQFHQELFAEKVCQTFVELNGKEPTVEELSNVFKTIRNKFAEEAREEFIEINNDEEDSDSDYEPNSKDANQIEIDNEIDQSEKVEIVYSNESEIDGDIDEGESQTDTEFETDSENDDSYDDDDQNESDLIIGYFGYGY